MVSCRTLFCHCRRQRETQLFILLQFTDALCVQSRFALYLCGSLLVRECVNFTSCGGGRRWSMPSSHAAAAITATWYIISFSVHNIIITIIIIIIWRLYNENNEWVSSSSSSSSSCSVVLRISARKPPFPPLRAQSNLHAGPPDGYLQYTHTRARVEFTRVSTLFHRIVTSGRHTTNEKYTL